MRPFFTARYVLEKLEEIKTCMIHSQSTLERAVDRLDELEQEVKEVDNPSPSEETLS